MEDAHAVEGAASLLHWGTLPHNPLVAVAAGWPPLQLLLPYTRWSSSLGSRTAHQERVPAGLVLSPGLHTLTADLVCASPISTFVLRVPSLAKVISGLFSQAGRLSQGPFSNATHCLGGVLTTRGHVSVPRRMSSS
eukprot:1151484-Pelagomonas_calceolata.AAC.3